MATQIKGKLVKRKKHPLDFGGNIDSSAPVDKLLENFQNLHIKNKFNQAVAFYNRTIRQRNTGHSHDRSYHFTVTGHPINAFTDDWDGDLNPGYFEPFSYKSMNPKMMTKMRNIEKRDPATLNLKENRDWFLHLHNLRKSAVAGRVLQKYEGLNEDVVMCPKHLVDMAAHLDSKPDPYFDSSYNWYYAGTGNLQLICVDWVDYLLHSEFSTMYVLQFSKNDMEVDFDHAATFNCDGVNILETVYSSQNVVALRTKNKIYILKIVTVDDKLQIEKVKTLESELPYTSIAFDAYHNNMLYVTTLDYKLTIVNLDRLTKRSVKLKCQIKSLVDNWSTVISSDRISYMHIAMHSITFYDKRTNVPSYEWKGVRYITDDPLCNDITVAKHCEGSPSLYFGTNHHLFLMDLRGVSKAKSKVVQRWTHGMQCVPTYMSICPFEYGKQIICLSSQWCEDTCVITNYVEWPKESNLCSVTVPYRPPSILKTLSQARESLLCFDLYNPIDKRLVTAITGTVIMEKGDNYIILMQNSLGDLSFHTLYPEHMEPFMEDNSVHHLHEWSKSYQIEKKTFEVSSIKDFTNVWKNLKKVPESHRIGEGKFMSKEKSKFDEKELLNLFETEQIDRGLLDIWMNDSDDSTAADESSYAVNLRYSDSDSG